SRAASELDELRVRGGQCLVRFLDVSIRIRVILEIAAHADIVQYSSEDSNLESVEELELRFRELSVRFACTQHKQQVARRGAEHEWIDARSQGRAVDDYDFIPPLQFGDHVWHNGRDQKLGATRLRRATRQNPYEDARRLAQRLIQCRSTVDVVEQSSN